MSTICLDVGATTTRVGLFSGGSWTQLPQPDGAGIPRIKEDSLCGIANCVYRFPTPSAHLFNWSTSNIADPGAVKAALLRRLEEIIRYVGILPTVDSVLVIAISFAGPVDRRNGVVQSAPNIWGDSPFDLGAALHARLALSLPTIRRVMVRSDDEAAGYRYLECPNLVGGCEQIHYLTIGSGHSGVRIDPATRELVAYECGHWEAIDDASSPLYLLCGCGRWGHLETLVAGRGAEQLADALARRSEFALLFSRSALSRQVDRVTTQAIVAAANAGDDYAQAIVRISARYLVSRVIRPLITSTPKRLRIILNGGYARAHGPGKYLGLVKDELLNNPPANATHHLSTDLIDNLVVMGFDDDYDALCGISQIAQAEMAGWSTSEN